MYAVRLDNVVDLGGYALKEAWNPATVWAFKDPAAQIKSAISVLGTLYDAVDGRKLVMGFKKPITGSNLEGSLVAAGVLQRSGNGAIEVRNHIECTNFVLKTPMEPLTIKYIKDIHVKLQLRRERHNLGLVAWRFLFGINGIQFFDAFCLCLEGLIWNSDVLVSAQLRPVAI